MAANHLFNVPSYFHGQGYGLEACDIMQFDREKMISDYNITCQAFWVCE
jgi:hypothetical protein